MLHEKLMGLIRNSLGRIRLVRKTLEPFTQGLFGLVYIWLKLHSKLVQPVCGR